jgi:predicted  nucleic acid-binding Zn-ribbon protein
MEKCVDCGHVLEDHDIDSGVVVGHCYRCDCDGFKARDDEDDEPMES